jgi:sulfite reductase alpha subunit-like flavoprotein
MEINMADDLFEQDVAKRLGKVFGREVTISPVSDFNGVPSFVIKAGTTKEGAEAVIDKLIETRKAAGLEKKDLPFKSDDKGNILIYGGDIIDYSGNQPIVKASTFKKIEDPKNAKAFQASFPQKERTITDDKSKVLLEAIQKMSDGLGNQDKEEPEQIGKVLIKALEDRPDILAFATQSVKLEKEQDIILNKIKEKHKGNMTYGYDRETKKFGVKIESGEGDKITLSTKNDLVRDLEKNFNEESKNKFAIMGSLAGYAGGEDGKVKPIFLRHAADTLQSLEGQGALKGYHDKFKEEGREQASITKPTIEEYAANMPPEQYKKIDPTRAALGGVAPVPLSGMESGSQSKA